MRVVSFIGDSLANYVIVTAYNPQITYGVYTILSIGIAYFSPSLKQALFNCTISYVCLGSIRPILGMIAECLATQDKVKEMHQANISKIFIH